MVIAGENICGMDPDAQFKNGKIAKSPEMDRRIEAFRRWYTGKGGIVVQANVEDTTLGVPEYVIEKLGVEIFELKWGQGAKNIGGEVKLGSIERALQLKERGYIVLPDPTTSAARRAYEAGSIKEFERHSRLGMVDEDKFYEQVEYLRALGAKYVTLKTGAYRPADLARALVFSSNAKIDLLTTDGAGGGTGMSPWRMMNEWGIPTVYLECLAYNMCERLKAQGRYIPPIAIAGGLSLEDHLFKALALGAPYVKAACVGRALMTAAMVGKTNGRTAIEKGEAEGKDIEDSMIELFAVGAELKERFGDEFRKLPPGAVGLYSYVERLRQGLQQLMAGARKFALQYIDRNDLVALTREASSISDIPYVMDSDAEEIEKILGGMAQAAQARRA
jgi:glutamate synthase domain-containing protein 2